MSGLALLFDVDGTLADTEAAHRDAFNEAFAEEGLDWHWSEADYLRLLAVAGGKERLAAHWRALEPEAPGGPAEEEPGAAALEAARAAVRAEVIERVHATKTRRYVAKAREGQLPLRPGVLPLLREARERGVPLALATTTTPANIDALLRVPLGEGWRGLFAAVDDASTAPLKKPHPQVYLQVLSALGKPATECLAFEDSQNGLRAARAAGLPTIVTPTAFTAREDFTGALAVRADLVGLRIADLEALAARSR